MSVSALYVHHYQWTFILNELFAVNQFLISPLISADLFFRFSFLFFYFSVLFLKQFEQIILTFAESNRDVCVYCCCNFDSNVIEWCHWTNIIYVHRQNESMSHYCTQLLSFILFSGWEGEWMNEWMNRTICSLMDFYLDIEFTLAHIFIKINTTIRHP